MTIAGGEWFGESPQIVLEGNKGMPFWSLSHFYSLQFKQHHFFCTLDLIICGTLPFKRKVVWLHKWTQDFISSNIFEYLVCARNYNSLNGSVIMDSVANFCKFKKGHVILATHGNIFSFRNVPLQSQSWLCYFYSFIKTNSALGGKCSKEFIFSPFKKIFCSRN